MSDVLFGFGFALITALVVIFGDYVLKIAADGGHSTLSALVVIGAGLYAVSALFWFYAMQHVTLAQAGVAYSMLTLLALCAIGAVFFNEKLYARELTGVACALLAMVLMIRVE